MAPGAPAGARLQETTRTMHKRADDQVIPGLALEMTFEAEAGIALLEHLVVDRAVNCVAHRAAFAHGFVLKDKGPDLRGVTGDANILFVEQGGATGTKRIVPMRVMAIAAGDPALEYRVMMRQAKLAAFVQVALETDLGRFAGVNDSMGIATGLGVQAARAMTTFAAHFLRRQIACRDALEMWIARKAEPRSPTIE